jgi:hypothetical protein
VLKTRPGRTRPLLYLVKNADYMKNLELLPAGEKQQKDIWRDHILLNGRTGIEMGYIGNIEGIHHFLVDYVDGYRGFHYSDEEIEEKAMDVIARLPGQPEINMSIVRH